MVTMSIITSMYNRKAEVLEIIDRLFLPSILNNGDVDMELIIIDDCSPLKKETITIIEKHLPALKSRFGDVSIIRNPVNLGFAKSFNKGIFMAKGKKVIIANDDLYFPLKSIKKLCETLDGPERYLIAGPITNADSTWSYQYCKQAPRINSYAPEELAKLERFSSWLSLQMQNKRMTTDNLCGFCFAADATFLKKMGGFNEKYNYGFYEDTDLFQRITGKYGKEKIAIPLDIFVGHGGIKGTSQSMIQQPVKVGYALTINAIKFANTWGYWKLIKRLAYGIRSMSGKGTISELFPEEVAF